MRKFNIFLMIVLLLMLAFCVYFFVGSSLHVQIYTATANASDYPEAFASIQNVLGSYSAPQRFTEDIPQNASDYRLVDITLQLSNKGIFDAEWVTAKVTGASGDVAVYSLTGDASTIEARSTGQINLKLITSAPADSMRRIDLEYYVFGMYRTVSITG